MIAEILGTIGIEGVLGGAIELGLIGLAIKEGFDLVTGYAKKK